MLRYMTAGESHGKALITILDGVPAGLKLSAGDINGDLKLRMQGYGRGKRMAIESDKAELIAGCRKGRTIGSPVGIMVANKDFKIDKLPDVNCPRPGHADLAGLMKYRCPDARDVLERASARETAARVAAGAVAKKILAEFGIKILSHVTMLGGIEAGTGGLSYKKVATLLKGAKKIRCADKEAEKLMCEEIDNAAKAGDTLGGAFEVIVEGVPAGLGTYAQWDRRMDASLARAVMSVPAVKAVSIGGGIEAAYEAGSIVHDEIAYSKQKKSFLRLSNNAGGIEGGITNGQPVVIEGFMKPIATLGDALGTVNIKTKKDSKASRERADVCAVGACGIVAEAVIAVELASAFLEKFGGDSISEITSNYKAYKAQLRKL
ncbi:MAG: chorismate synthase [Candidatus Tantalella remota]|nr:chorismate synthase [Candidatus Tantalella remota]